MICCGDLRGKIGMFAGQTSGYVNSLLLNMAIEIVDFPIKNGGSFHSSVSLPEGQTSKASMFNGIFATATLPSLCGTFSEGAAALRRA